MILSRLTLLTLLAGACSPTEDSSAQDVDSSASRVPKVLLIGIDGVRPDSLAAAETPNLDRLSRAGAINSQAQTCAHTVSGPSWMSILTGVWPNKHGVNDNTFEGIDSANFPHFLARAESIRADLRTVSITQWSPLMDKAVPGADFSSAPDSGAAVTIAAVDELSNNNPDLVFLHFDGADHAGHASGYGPEFPEYIESIENVDGEIGKVVAALNARATITEENWLILVTTDHGGTGTSHGQDIPLHRTVFLIASGDWQGGPMRWRAYAEVVDLVPTIFRHLGIAVDETWHFDGVPMGMSGPNQAHQQKSTSSFLQTFPGSEASIEMLPIEGGEFWLSSTEIPWEVFDLFFLRNDQQIEADGISGPSKSVFPVGRGYGHEGHPALGMTFSSARNFCAWLSKSSGRNYRLPTEDEWALAAVGAQHGWSSENSDQRPRACAQLPPEANGLHDIIGNLAEWTEDGSEQGVVCGGSYLDQKISAGIRAKYEISWQARDPQWPKSSWWMSDCGWVGIRVLCESP